MSAATNGANIVDRTIVPHKAFEQALERLEACYTYSGQGSTATCLAIVGASRCGKSAVLTEFCAQHPRSRTPNGALVPVLKVIADQAPTVKNITEAMLIELGDPAAKRATGARLLQTLVKLLKATQTRVIIIDEFQHFQEKHSNKILHEVADFLKNLVEKTGISLVVAGLPNSLEVIRSNSQLVNRFQRPVDMPCFDWAVEEQRQQFMWIMSSFEASMGSVLSLPCLSQPDMAYRFYHASGGAIGNVASILRAEVRCAVAMGRSESALEDLHRAFDAAVFRDDLKNPFTRDFLVEPSEARDASASGAEAEIGTPLRRRKKGGV